MKRALLAFIFCFIMASIGLAGDSAMLLTPQEGALPDAPSGLIEVGRDLGDGPLITVVAPRSGESYRPPLEVTIHFAPREGSLVDLSQLRVECLKVITIDITERVMPYATEEGIAISAADLPRGRHKIRLRIGDRSGGVSEEVFVVNVL